ncbi:MAG TPA: putative lipid II flippase FtsW [Chloroflexota bacterium]|nr:putative lipid II flippase FtsW [Chloroflexota bacterium]
MQRNVARARQLAGGVDTWLTLAFLALMCIGVLMVYSASIADAYIYYGSPLYVFQRELVWVGLGFVAMAVAVRVDYRHLQRFALPIFAVSLFLLFAVLAPHVGQSSHGAQRWFGFGSITIEPSELIKLALAIYMAAWLTSKGEMVRDFKHTVVPFSMMVGLVAILIVRQPDLGTTIVVTLTMFSVLFIAGASLTHIAAITLGASGVGLMLARGSSYRTGRLTAFMNPWHDPTGVGYHTVQALLALGSGGIFGQGLGNSVQKNVLPAPHTDSILAIIGEEWGIIGTVCILLLFVLVAYRGIRITLTAPDNFSRLLAAGITSWITFQAMLNFAVITSSVPFTGVPLPFISYGGTSLIVSMVAVGILLNISRHTSGEGIALQAPHHGRRDGGARLPRTRNHSVAEPRPVPDRKQRPRVGPKPAAATRRPRLGAPTYKAGIPRSGAR